MPEPVFSGPCIFQTSQSLYGKLRIAENPDFGICYNSWINHHWINAMGINLDDIIIINQFREYTVESWICTWEGQ